jgi:hypothetical protein
MALLPEFCFIPHPENPLLIAKIQRGQEGYLPFDSMEDPDALNAALGINGAQVAAMKFGSLFGFQGALADPDTYDEHGRPKPGIMKTLARRRWT